MSKRIRENLRINRIKLKMSLEVNGKMKRNNFYSQKMKKVSLTNRSLNKSSQTGKQ